MLCGILFANALMSQTQFEGKVTDAATGKTVITYLSLQVPDENSKMKQPYIYIVPSDVDIIPWAASQRDILETDWYVV